MTSSFSGGDIGKFMAMKYGCLFRESAGCALSPGDRRLLRRWCVDRVGRRKGFSSIRHPQERTGALGWGNWMKAIAACIM